jgi:hypothetical protein
MPRRIIPLLLLLAIGCGQSTSPSKHTAMLQGYINGWENAGMYLPDQEQIGFFHLCLPESEEPLVAALNHPAHKVRMRGFKAPLVVVRRKSDGKKGSLEFQHQPRFYFGFSPHEG